MSKIDANDPVLKLCLQASPSREVISHAIGTDRQGRGIMFKFRMCTDHTETVFMPAAGVEPLIGVLTTDLAAVGALDPGHIAVQLTQGGPHVPYNEARPKLSAKDWRIDDKDGKTISAHASIVVMMNVTFFLFTIPGGPVRIFRLDNSQCFVLIDDLREARPYMKVNRTKPPTSSRIQ